MRASDEMDSHVALGIANRIEVMSFFFQDGFVLDDISTKLVVISVHLVIKRRKDIGSYCVCNLGKVHCVDDVFHNGWRFPPPQVLKLLKLIQKKSYLAFICADRNLLAF